jgi:hypothetical protein
MAYLAASAYRAARLFVIGGSPDPFTAQQFTASGRIFLAGRLISLVTMALFAAGVVVAVRRGADVLLFAALIAYVPATICFMLINMRYSVTVQPYVLLFAAIALDALIQTSAAKPSR